MRCRTDCVRCLRTVLKASGARNDNGRYARYHYCPRRRPSRRQVQRRHP